MLDASELIVIAGVLQACREASRKTLPPHLVPPVAALLTRLAVSPELRDGYWDVVADALEAAERRHPGTRRLVDAGDSGDIPEGEIARRGFDWLSPEQLADYALSPEAVEAIASRLLDEDLVDQLGPWHAEAAAREEERRPADPERDRKLDERLRAAIHAGPSVGQP